LPQRVEVKSRSWHKGGLVIVVHFHKLDVLGVKKHLPGTGFEPFGIDAEGIGNKLDNPGYPKLLYAGDSEDGKELRLILSQSLWQ
jgi:hypothetical protein